MFFRNRPSLVYGVVISIIGYMSANFVKAAEIKLQLTQLELQLAEQRGTLTNLTEEHAGKPFFKRLLEGGATKDKKEVCRKKLQEIGLQKGKLLASYKAEQTQHVDTFRGAAFVGHEQEIRDAETYAATARMNLAEPIAIHNQIAQVQQTVKSAQSSVRGAQGMEMVDLFTKNKAISFLSSIDNSAANSAIQRVKSEMKRLSERIKGFKPHAATGVNDNMDLVFDLVGIDFDFLSWQSLSQLDKAAANLKKIDTQLERLHGDFKPAVMMLHMANNKPRFLRERYEAAAVTKGETDFNERVNREVEKIKSRSEPQR